METDRCSKGLIIGEEMEGGSAARGRGQDDKESQTREKMASIGNNRC